jgi:hypothetical protein
MKVSQVIMKLQELYEELGDVQVILPQVSDLTYVNWDLDVVVVERRGNVIVIR